MGFKKHRKKMGKHQENVESLDEAPFVGFGAPDAAVSLKFIDADG